MSDPDRAGRGFHGICGECARAMVEAAQPGGVAAALEQRVAPGQAGDRSEGSRLISHRDESFHFCGEVGAGGTAFLDLDSAKPLHDFVRMFAKFL
ncbi:MAG: hypothetical protein ACRDFS_06865 [Chloroflexota bacterium]